MLKSRNYVDEERRYHREDGPAAEQWREDGSLMKRRFMIHGQLVSSDDWSKVYQEEYRLNGDIILDYLNRSLGLSRRVEILEDDTRIEKTIHMDSRRLHNPTGPAVRIEHPGGEVEEQFWIKGKRQTKLKN